MLKAQTKLFGVCICLIFAPLSVSAQSPPDLKFAGHTLGETAEAFFLTATFSETKQLAKDYCKTLLDDSKIKEMEREKDAVDKNGGVFTLSKKDFSFLDVGNCRQLMAALRGEQANVGGRLASEIGKGSALFA